MNSILALDVGESRIGVAAANDIARLAHPLTTLNNSETVWDEIRSLAQAESATIIVVGLPRNLSGEDTAQTEYVRRFVADITDMKIVFQDEALPSRQAESELNQRRKPFSKGDIDALAAHYISEPYLIEQKGSA